MKIKNSRVVIWYSAISVAILTGLYVIFAPKPTLIESVVATRGEFQEKINADGIVRAKNHHTVTAFAEGDIKMVTLKVGDPIKKGETITELLWDIKYQPVPAPLDGVISKVFRETAGPIHRGEPIVEIVNPSELEMMAELLTPDAVQVKVGDPVFIEGTGDSKAITTKVSRISKAGFTKISALGVEEEKTEVTADLSQVPPEILKKLGSNFHVNLSILISEHMNSLKVPIGSLFKDQNNWAVYKIDGRRARIRNVKVAARNSDEAMITEGLNEGDEIINYPGDLIRDGSKVRKNKFNR